MKQAILQGREVGMNFRTNNDKTQMPTFKARIIHPVAMGYDTNGNLVFRGLHITGQSEKAARATGIRSAEVEAQTDGMGAWRLFRGENTRSMWFTGRFFSDSIPGFSPSDSAMSSQMATYNPAAAKAYQDSIVVQGQDPVQPQEPAPQKEPAPQIQPEPQVPVDKDIDQVAYEDQPIQEKKKSIRNFFK